MKTQKGVRGHDSDELRKAKRLEPLRKSGKERHALYSSIARDEEDEEDYTAYPRRESALDYLSTTKRRSSGIPATAHPPRLPPRARREIPHRRL